METTKPTQLDSKQELFINQVAPFFPDRRSGKRGPKPISKLIILKQLFVLVRTNCGWRNIKHSTVCRNYLEECQRRGLYKKFFNFITKGFYKYRPDKSIVDSSVCNAYRNLAEVSYNHKYHKNGTKITLEITPEGIPLTICFSKGSAHDSPELDRLLMQQRKKPYELYLDMAYEHFRRRRILKKYNCQVRMRQRHTGKNRKRGRKFTWLQEHYLTREKIERVFFWIKSFRAVGMRLTRKAAIYHAFTYIALSNIAWRKINYEHA